MTDFKTEYGNFTEIQSYNLYDDNTLKDCMCRNSNMISTKYGSLIPQYDFKEVRRLTNPSVTFTKSQKLKSISLNSLTPIETSVGTLNVEYLTFYENGNIETLYPLNGQLSPYWQENQEYELAQSTEISLPFGKIKAKIKVLYFYQTGELKGITMWPGERIEIPTPLGNQPARLGAGFFEDGTVKSFEPAEPLSLNTPIGEVIAFDANNYSYFRESKAVTFTKDGQLEAIFTSNNIISVTDSDGELTDFAPTCYEDEYSESNIYVYPMQIDFEEGNITFNRVDKFKLSETKFAIHEMLIEMEKQECTEDCSTCSSTCTPGGISLI